MASQGQKYVREFNPKAEFRKNQKEMSQKFNHFRADLHVFKDLCENHIGLGLDSVNEIVTALEEQLADLINVLHKYIIR